MQSQQQKEPGHARLLPPRPDPLPPLPRPAPLSVAKRLRCLSQQPNLQLLILVSALILQYTACIAHMHTHLQQIQKSQVCAQTKRHRRPTETYGLGTHPHTDTRQGPTTVEQRRGSNHDDTTPQGCSSYPHIVASFWTALFLMLPGSLYI